MTEAPGSSPRERLRSRLAIFAMDGALLGLFMLSACVTVLVLEHPASAVHAALPSPLLRRALVGVAMGLTAVSLIYSPWGKRSGAFMNPAMVLCFWRLGKLASIDAAGYIVAQLVGGAGGVLVAALAFPGVGDPAVNYVVTAPAGGTVIAFATELALSFVMLSVVMTVNRSPRWAPYAGAYAAALVALFIGVAAPISGMSINPARSFASAVWAAQWTGFWIYVSAPPLGMLVALELQGWLTSRHERRCGKLNHDETIACFVRCDCLKEHSP